MPRKAKEKMWFGCKLCLFEPSAKKAESVLSTIDLLSDPEFSDFNNIESCKTNLKQIHEEIYKLRTKSEFCEWTVCPESKLIQNRHYVTSCGRTYYIPTEVCFCGKKVLTKD